MSSPVARRPLPRPCALTLSNNEHQRRKCRTRDGLEPRGERSGSFMMAPGTRRRSRHSVLRLKKFSLTPSKCTIQLNRVSSVSAVVRVAHGVGCG